MGMESKLGQQLEYNGGSDLLALKAKRRRFTQISYLEFELIIDVSSSPWFILVNPNVT